MENENNVVTEQKNEPVAEPTAPKKSGRNWGFTIFACVATAIIVVLGINLGNKLAEGKDSKPSKNNTTSNEVSNENSNETSNEVSNENSNETSNSTSNVSSSMTINGFYSAVYETTSDDNKRDVIIHEVVVNNDKTCSYTYYGLGSGANNYKGTCEENGNKLVLKANTKEEFTFNIANSNSMSTTYNNKTINFNKVDLNASVVGKYTGSINSGGNTITKTLVINSDNTCEYSHTPSGSEGYIYKGKCVKDASSIRMSSTSKVSGSLGKEEKSDENFLFVLTNNGTVQVKDDLGVFELKK